MSIVIMVLLLSFLILVHELGHFITARALGIKVSKFALGFPIGPTLWSKKIGDIEYLVHACLLGGYVAFPDDDKDSDIPLDSPERFANNPIWKRMLVISAGVLTNLIVAFLLVFLVAGIWGELPSGESEVYAGKIVAEKGSSVWDSGMQEGDLILTINGSEIKSGYALSLYAKNSAQYDGKIDNEILADNITKLEALNEGISSDELIEKGTEVKLPALEDEPAIKFSDEILKGLAFYKDKQIKLDDKQIKLRDKLQGETQYISDGKTTLADIAYAISDSKRPLDITVKRGEDIIDLKTIYPNKDGMIGIMQNNKPQTVKTKTFGQIIKGGSDYLVKQTSMQIYGFWQLITGKIPAKEIHGIVAVAKIGGDVINNGGMASGLLLTAIISAWLAILNFLPIPALDGGHFMFLIVEKFRGKPVSDKTIEILGNIFFIALIILAFLLIFNDIYALVMHKL